MNHTLQLMREHQFVYEIKHRVRCLGRENAYGTIMNQLETMRNFHNPFESPPAVAPALTGRRPAALESDALSEGGRTPAAEPARPSVPALAAQRAAVLEQYRGIETTLHGWIRRFEARFVKELHDELELYLNGTGRVYREYPPQTKDISLIPNVRMIGENFCQSVRQIRSYSDYAELHNQLKKWLDSSEPSLSPEQNDCILFLSSFLHDEEVYANIISKEEQKNEEDRLDAILLNLKTQMAQAIASDDETE